MTGAARAPGRTSPQEQRRSRLSRYNTDMAHSTWDELVMPLLAAVAEIEADPDLYGSILSLDAVVERAGLEGVAPVRELQRLLEDGYVTAVVIDGGAESIDDDLYKLRLAPAGARALGTWPAHGAYDRLIERLAAAAESPELPEAERSKVRRALEAVGAVTRDVMVQVTAEVVARQVP